MNYNMEKMDDDTAILKAEIEILIDTKDFPEIVENIEGILDHYNRGVK